MPTPPANMRCSTQEVTRRSWKDSDISSRRWRSPLSSPVRTETSPPSGPNTAHCARQPGKQSSPSNPHYPANQLIIRHLRQTCVFCVYCKERTHMRDDCPRLQVKAERELARMEWQERQDRYRARQEEREQRSLQQGIRSGRVAVGNDGKTIWL